VFIEAKDDAGGGDNWTSGAIIVVQRSSQIITTNIQFLQAGCPSCRPTNSVKALNGKISHSVDLLTQAHLGSSNFVWFLFNPRINLSPFT